MFTAGYIAALLGGCVLMFWLLLHLLVGEPEALARLDDDAADSEVELVGFLGLGLIAVSVGFMAIGYVAGA